MPILFLPRRPGRPRLTGGPLPATSWGNSVSVVAVTSAGDGYIAIAASNFGGDHNEVWKSTDGTTFIRLSASLPLGGTFRDYNVASDTIYFYFLRVINANLSYLDSAIQSSSVTLSAARIHLVAKHAADNISSTYGVLTAPLMAPLSRPTSRDSKVLIEPGRTKPIIATSPVVERSYQGILVFTGYPNADLVSLRNMFDQHSVFCVRDTMKHILFGTFSTFRVTHQHTASYVELDLTETDYLENIA